MMERTRRRASDVKNVVRTPEIQGDKILMKTSFDEEISVAEFLQSYNMKKSELDNLQYQKDNFLKEASEINNIEITEELRELMGKLDLIENYKRKEMLTANIKDLDNQISEITKDLDALTSTVEELKKNKK